MSGRVERCHPTLWSAVCVSEVLPAGLCEQREPSERRTKSGCGLVAGRACWMHFPHKPNGMHWRTYYRLRRFSRWCASASIIGNDASLRATAAARPQPGLSTDPAVSHNGKSTRKRQKNRQEVTQRQHHYAWRIFGGHKSSNQRVLRAGLESRFDGVGSIGRTLRLPPRPRRKRNPYDAVAYFWHIARLVWLAQTGCAR
jgi:hypothetical protein